MEKIRRLRKLFEKENVDGYLVSKNDEFFSEYVPYHNDRLKHISNFSGSYGFSLILKNKSFFELVNCNNCLKWCQGIVREVIKIRRSGLPRVLVNLLK